MVAKLANEIQSGSRRALAKGLSLIESTLPLHQQQSYELLKLLFNPAQRSKRIGITGAPGVGKSSLMESLGLAMIERGEKVAVLAVDPSSKRTGGSILGDKVRMPELSLSENAFIRPSPSSTRLGGATQSTREAILLCEAAGYSTIVVETVGVGQSETEVSDMVDCFLLLTLANAGDEIQGIKRGIMELADVVVVTKSDLQPQATQRAVAMFTSVLRMIVPGNADWKSVCVPATISDANGILPVVATITQFFAETRWKSIALKRSEQNTIWFTTLLQQTALKHLSEHEVIQQFLRDAKQKISSNELIPSVAVYSMFQHLELQIEITR